MDNYVGKRLDGRYEILEIIGVGGMAVVYKAFDNIDERIVAVKILKDEFLENEEFRRRFKNESKAIAVLSHPNIVKVYDVSFGNLLQYIVMEYVEGITLKEYIQQQHVVKQREAVHFITQILRALQHAHDKGIIHRDIKPQNIMLISDGTIKVTDFGIAHFSRGETRTMTESAIGSVHYISPEQAKGTVIDAKTDIYSAGVMLYEMLTGSLPFQSENAVSVALMQLQQQAIRPRAINPNIAVALEQIVIRAMQKNPADRYQSAAEMLLDIEAFKKNPSIKFDYAYMVDKQPARFVPAAVDNVITDAEEEPPYIEPIEDDDADESITVDTRSRKKSIIVLVSLLVLLVAFAGVLIKFFGIANMGERVAVPDFLGKMISDIYTDAQYEPYTPYIDLENDPSSDKPDGMIVEQKPGANKKINLSKKRITLVVAGNGNTDTVPDVKGLSFDEAKKKMNARGFTVTTENLFSEDVEVGVVIKTSPASGEPIEKGGMITLYVATDVSTETVIVPTLFGCTLEEAEQQLEEIGLELDSSKTEYRASVTEKRGTVIGNSHAGDSVPLGTKIAVYVSSGRGSKQNQNVSFMLPNVKNADGKPASGNLLVYVNGELRLTKSVPLDGSRYTTTIAGSGENDVVTVKVDNQTVYKSQVNFLSGQVSSESSGSYKTSATKSTESTSEEKTTESSSSEKTTESTSETKTTKPSSTEVVKPTKPSTSESTTESTTERTTESTTESTKESTTESTKPSTKPSTEPPTKPSTQAPTKPSTKPSTEPSTQAPTAPPINTVAEPEE